MSDEGDDKPSAASASGISPEMIEYLKVSPAKKLENGIASGSLGLLRPDLPFPEPDKYPEEQTDGVWGVHLRELQDDYGVQLCGKVLLDDEKFGRLERRAIAEISAEIQGKVTAEAWEKISHWAAHYALRHQGHHDVYIRAIWVQEFEELMSEVWLAAKAMYARHIEKNDFAYGYLIALLDQKLGKDKTFRSGLGTEIGGSRGGNARSGTYLQKRNAVIRAMKTHRANGSTIKRAAELACIDVKNTTVNGNIGFWKRYSKK